MPDEFYKNIIGKSINDISTLSNIKGIVIFILDNDPNDKFGMGQRIWGGIFMRDFIYQFPQYENAIIEKSNGFYGSITIRIRAAN